MASTAPLHARSTQAFSSSSRRACQSREVCGKEQPRASQTICRLANGFSSVLLENQMGQRPHEENSVEGRADHGMEVSCVSHDKLHSVMQSRSREPELTSLEQGRRQINRRDRVAASAQSERVSSCSGSDLKDGPYRRQVSRQVAPREVVLELMHREPCVLVLHAAVVGGCSIADVVSHASISFTFSESIDTGTGN